MPRVLPEGSLAALALAGVVMVALAVLMVKTPLANAGRPEDPAPPTAIM
jgi:hypothetical protein